MQAIAKSDAAPTFANTIEALERSGRELDRVRAVFFGLQSAETNDRHQATAKEVAPLLSSLRDDIALDEGLFRRVRTVWEARDGLELDGEQRMLLRNTYRDFVRGGASLDAKGKERLRAINTELSVLGVKFGENVLAETNAYRLVIERREDLAGLPDLALLMDESHRYRAAASARALNDLNPLIGLEFTATPQGGFQAHRYAGGVHQGVTAKGLGPSGSKPFLCAPVLASSGCGNNRRNPQGSPAMARI